ncbi:DUF4271 domain-containing protein [Flavobacterium nackdongense]|uniref:DUF4271 domain-containing protein n=1 Tax=Flavobacterium nackdongense TaxID=2547394 RepID=A0A4P6Y984_9FLAO|nr:DUF4271 domain-containing protein [Flavobacterium nackdongense]QBN19561.1 DUF4271 domain-containing protein [Flavobacterium nackdongense]
MIDTVLHFRVVENKDWATILFVIAFATIALTKSAFENRFAEFAKLIYSDKYTNVYKDGSHLNSGFTIALFFVQLISFSFFIQISLANFGYGSKTDWILFIQIITFLIYFVFSKFLIEKIIATAFSIEEIIEQFNLQKVTFRTYIGIFLLPINIILFYYDAVSREFMLVLISILLISSVLTYLVSIKNYQNIIFSKLFYFILYLCALEIAPYYFMYYWFTKGIA